MTSPELLGGCVSQQVQGAQNTQGPVVTGREPGHDHTHVARALSGVSTMDSSTVHRKPGPSQRPLPCCQACL